MAINNGLASPQDQNLGPNLTLGDFRGTKYPNPFFDLAQQYMPPTIKELFRWCTFYYYNSPLIGAAIRKISRYPITDLIFEDEHETIRDLWSKILVDILKIKDRKMEVNLDLHCYGNAFVSLHKPFTRFLVCKVCKGSAPIRQWDWKFRSATYAFMGKCPGCKATTDADVKDVPYKDIRGVRLIRWNPENIHLKFNEYTGRYVYMYTVPGKLKNMILRGDKDILEDLPLIVLDAVKSRRMIRFDQDNIFHLKAPTLAEQDQGWGKPLILHVLKDMFYFYTLRRAQEAIAQEHILPFDMIYPMPNGQQDPYLHTDLGNWRNQIEQQIQRHRRDPNFKAVVPIPVGFGRLGGDGKALLLSPEMNYITQTVVGGMGIPQEFIFGGLNFTGSSISLRTLENDFIQNRSQLLDLVYWIKDKLRVWMGLPNIEKIRFADFRMADDVQRNQQLIGLNAQGKVSDQTLLTELGYDYDQEVKKRIEEIFVANYLGDLQAKGAAKTQGEAQIIQTNYQSKIQEIATKAQQDMAKRLGLPPGGAVGPDGQPAGGQPAGGVGPAAGAGDPALEQGGAQPSGGAGGEWPAGGQAAQAAQPAGGAPGAGTGGVAAANATAAPGVPAAGAGATAQPGVQPVDPNMQIQAWIGKWVNQLTKMQPAQAKLTLNELKVKLPEIGSKVEQAYNEALATQTGPGVNTQPNMDPLPQRGAPRRQELTAGEA